MCPSPRAYMTRLVHEAGLRYVLPRTRGSSLHMQGLRTAPCAAPLCSATCLSFCVSPHRSGCRVVLRIVSQHDTEVAPQDVIVVRRGGRRRFRCRCQVCVGRRRPRWVRQQRRCLQADLEGLLTEFDSKRIQRPRSQKPSENISLHSSGGPTPVQLANGSTVGRKHGCGRACSRKVCQKSPAPSRKYFRNAARCPGSCAPPASSRQSAPAACQCRLGPLRSQRQR